MADPVGAPTFFQIFSPAKSPLYATALIALACLLLIKGQALAKYGTGLAIFILALSVFIAPVFKTKQKFAEYKVNIVYARAAGVIGGLVSLSLLILGSVDKDGTGKLWSESAMFQMIWTLCVFQVLATLALFLCRPKGEESDTKTKRYNLVQFAVIQSVLLLGLTLLGLGAPELMTSNFLKMCLFGAVAVAASPFQVFLHFNIPVETILYTVVFLWTANLFINLAPLKNNIAFGWIDSHEEEGKA